MMPPRIERLGWIGMQLASIMVASGWCLSLALGATSYATFPRSFHNFALMTGGAGSEWKLAAVCGVCALSGIVSMAWPSSFWLAILAALLLGTLHGVIALVLHQATPFGTGTLTYGVVALLGYALIIRAPFLRERRSGR